MANHEDREQMSQELSLDTQSELVMKSGDESITSIKEEGAPIEKLPDELLENIFCRISPYDDLDHVKAVSRRWNRIAQSKFICELRVDI